MESYGEHGKSNGKHGSGAEEARAKNIRYRKVYITDTIDKTIMSLILLVRFGLQVFDQPLGMRTPTKSILRWSLVPLLAHA